MVDDSFHRLNVFFFVANREINDVVGSGGAAGELIQVHFLDSGKEIIILSNIIKREMQYNQKKIYNLRVIMQEKIHKKRNIEGKLKKYNIFLAGTCQRQRQDLHSAPSRPGEKGKNRV